MSDQSNAIAGADQPSARRSIIFTDGTDAIGEVVPAADGPSPIEGRLRKAPLRVPEGYGECTGFTLFGRRIRSLLYSTDVAVIRNSNADAIFAVYPFTAQPAITQALLTVAEAPLFVGVGGGTLHLGDRGQLGGHGGPGGLHGGHPRGGVHHTL